MVMQTHKEFTLNVLT